MRKSFVMFVFVSLLCRKYRLALNDEKIIVWRHLRVDDNEKCLSCMTGIPNQSVVNTLNISAEPMQLLTYVSVI